MCKHKHTCDQCVREEIAELQKKLEALIKKLPPIVNIIKYVPYPNVVTVPVPSYPQWNVAQAIGIAYPHQLPSGASNLHGFTAAGTAQLR